MFKWVNWLTKSRKGTRLNDILFVTVYLCVFCSSLKTYSALQLNISCELCHVSPPSQIDTNSIQFAPFTWSIMTLYLFVLHFADLFSFFKWYFKRLQYYVAITPVFILFFPPFVCCMAIKQCDRQESFLSTSRHIFY